ncbi:hypothetical protein ACLK2F_10500 [Escherichia coli]
MKVCRARVVPLFPIYDGKTNGLTIQVRRPMDDLLEADDRTIARRMGEESRFLLAATRTQHLDTKIAENSQTGRNPAV